MDTESSLSQIVSIIDNENKSLSALLKEETMSAHLKTEGTSFVKNLFDGRISSEQYHKYLWALKEVYETLESHLQKKKNICEVSLIDFPELYRLTSLETDLQESSIYSSTISPSHWDCVKNYKRYLTSIAFSSPELLIAHAYVRYMGDISGGQILSKILRKSFGPNISLKFYEYSNLDINMLKKNYRNALDEIGIKNPNLKINLVKEAKLAFDYNTKIFLALEESENRELLT